MRKTKAFPQHENVFFFGVMPLGEGNHVVGSYLGSLIVLNVLFITIIVLY